MISKKILLPILVGSAFYLGACGDDNPSSPEAQTPVSSPVILSSSAIVVPGSSAIVPGPVSSSSVIVPVSSSTPAPVSSSAAPVPASSATPSAYAQLASTANTAYAINHYMSWQSYHFVTEETEMVTYPSIAGDFGVVFSAGYQPAGRVVWSIQTGYYKSLCTVNDATVQAMKFRGCTVSEGIGYGMLLAAFNNDVDTYNRLWNYSRAFRAYHNVKLMPWITKSFHWEMGDNSSATDADLDIATSLIVMYYKTQNAAYLQDALTFINAIWELEVNPTNMLIYSGDQDAWKGSDPVYNLSYFSPVALRLFAMVDPNHNWKGVLDAMYTYMQLVQSMGTGVFPDWSNTAGNAVDPNNGSAKDTYWTFNKESVRIPWRIAWDYYWYQDARAASILNTLNTFIAGKSNNNPNDMALSVNYSWNLSVGADYTRNTVVSGQWYGAWCATGIAGNATWLNACTQGLNTKTLTNGGNSYFSDILITMYSALLNGLFVRPAGI